MTCPGMRCRGVLRVQKTEIIGRTRRRYRVCDRCGGRMLTTETLAGPLVLPSGRPARCR